MRHQTNLRFRPGPTQISPYTHRCRLQTFGFNPFMMSGLTPRYNLDESTVTIGGIKSDLDILFDFSMKILSANRIAPDGTPRSAASHLGLYTVCLWPVKRTPGLTAQLTTLLVSHLQFIGFLLQRLIW